MMSIAEAHGVIAGGEVAVIALGRLGGREMTAASDLDLILVYDIPNPAVASDGKQPLPPGPYYARLTQRLVAALSAPTAEGRLFEVDFRLRPSGNSGPLATGLGAFIEYQARVAETWERLALTRARVVAGDARVAARTEKAIGDILVAPAKEGSRFAADILEMRTLIETEKGGGGPWDIKQAPGGLVDVEFITQYLQLIHMRHHPDLARVETEDALRAEAAAGVLEPGDAAILMPAVRLYQSLNQIIRLCVEEPFEPKEAPRGLRDLLCRVADAPDFTRLEAQLIETETKVRETLERLIGKVGPRRKPR
jgi:glutamate-ammonia-ligase adenylyltransferase